MSFAPTQRRVKPSGRPEIPHVVPCGGGVRSVSRGCVETFPRGTRNIIRLSRKVGSVLHSPPTLTCLLKGRRLAAFSDTRAEMKMNASDRVGVFHDSRMPTKAFFFPSLSLSCVESLIQ